jgi:antirestriction protein ArdC
MGQPKPSKSVYEIVTEKILDELSKGKIPWHKPWSTSAPYNAISKKEYRGVNPLVLACSPYSDPRWLTYKQSTELGGSIKKGEHGSIVVFWKFLDKKTTDNTEQEGTELEVKKQIPLLRYYTVFNVEQTEGIEWPVLDKKKEHTAEERHSRAQDVINKYDGPTIEENGGDRACYSPDLDRIMIPNRVKFNGLDEFYSTLLHECVHSTGHTTRLKRTFGEHFGNETYSKEELIAEIGAAFLCGMVGIETTIKNSAAYVAGWSSKLKDDSRLIVIAAGAAQKAADFILKNEETE